MFSWGGCLIKLLISVAAACAMGGEQMGWTSVATGVLLYGVISAWWYCCCLSGNFIIGTILFLVVVIVATWGASAEHCAEGHLLYCAGGYHAGRRHSGY